MTGNPPGILKEVKGYMEFWGWTNGGGPNSVKLDENGNAIAGHGGKVWIADVEKATAAIKSLANRVTGRRGGGGGGRRNE